MRRLALVSAVVLLAAGCASGKAGSTARSTVPTSPADARHPVAVPGTFGSWEIAVGSDRVVAVTRQPYSVSTPSTVTVVDLRRGTARSVRGPVDGKVPVSIGGLVADGDGFVGLGTRCVPPGGGEGCQGAKVLLHLDPASGTWTTDALSTDVGTYLDALHPTDDGTVVVASDRTGQRISRLTADHTWKAVATLATTNRRATCIAGGDLWAFARGRGSSDPQESDTMFGVTRVDLADGTTTAVAPPSLAASFGGVTVQFGCGASGPLLVSAPAGAVPPAGSDEATTKKALTGITGWRWRHGAWQRIDTGSSAPAPWRRRSRRDRTPSWSVHGWERTDGTGRSRSSSDRTAYGASRPPFGTSTHGGPTRSVSSTSSARARPVGSRSCRSRATDSHARRGCRGNREGADGRPGSAL